MASIVPLDLARIDDWRAIARVQVAEFREVSQRYRVVANGLLEWR